MTDELPLVQCFKCKKPERMQAAGNVLQLPRGWHRLDVQSMGRGVLLCSDCIKEVMQKPKG